MRKTLETIAKRAKQSFVKASAMLGLGASLSPISPLSPVNYDAKGKVLLSLESKNMLNISERVTQPGTVLKIFVNLDNTNDTNATVGAECNIKAPNGFRYIRSLTPNPYLTNSQPYGQANDFFDSFPMNPNSNTKDARFTQNQIGPKNRKGWFRIDHYQVDENIFLDTPVKVVQNGITNTYNTTCREFEVSGKSYSPDGTLQDVKGSKMKVVIADYGIVDQAPYMILDSNHGIPSIHVSDTTGLYSNRRFAIEAQRIPMESIGISPQDQKIATDNRNWTRIFTNENLSPEYQTWLPFTFDDKDATNYSGTLYRAVSVDDDINSINSKPR